MSKDIRTHNLSIFVANRPGALVRIAQAFSRRGFNIESLVVSPGARGDFSRALPPGQPGRAGQIISNAPLVDVICREQRRKWSRELALVKVAIDPERRTVSYRRPFPRENQDWRVACWKPPEARKNSTW